MRLPGVGVYDWSDRGDVVAATPEPDVAEAAVHDTFRRCVLPMVLQTRGLQVLHASAIVRPDGVVTLCARSRTGKSTLAFALSRALDCAIWADDAVAFEPGRDGGVSSVPVPFSLKLREPSAAHFGADGAGAPREPPVTRPPLRALFILTRSESRKAPRVTRLASARAFTSLLEHAYCFDLEDAALRGRMVRDYLELAARVPAFELEFPSDFAALDRTVNEIAGALG